MHNNKNIITYKINFEYSNLIEARPNDYQGFILAYRQIQCIGMLSQNVKETIFIDIINKL